MTDNIANLAAARAKKRGDGQQQPPAGSKDDRPVINIEAGELPKIIDEAEAALIKLEDGLYKQGPRVVRVVWEKVKVAGGEEGDALRISEVTAPHLVERFTAAARWHRWDVRTEDWKVCNCPPAIAETYLARNGDWSLPFILGVVTTPIIRLDGSVLDKPGYDAKTGIIFNPLGVTFPPIPENPTKEDAAKALLLLKRPLEMFPFSNPASKSVALSGIITALVRRSLPTAPMHAFSAPTAGSGKSLLVDIASMIATGERASVTSTGRDKFGDAELEKRLTASMLAGDLVLSIDNLEHPLGGELLCQLLTQTTAKLRVLGRSENVDTPISTSFFATGNNLTVVGDLTRRVLVGNLDVTDERPELRRFDFHPVAMAKEFRGELVQAALTIVRAYILSKDRVDETPLGSFNEWCRMVREPLMWLGEADPVDVLEDVRKGDPRLSRLKQMMDAWANAFGDGAVKVRDVVRRALENDPENGQLVDPDLREAVVAVAGGDKFINAEKVAWWLRKNAGRYIGKSRFERVGDGQIAEWALVGASQKVAGKMQSVGTDNDIPF